MVEPLTHEEVERLRLLASRVLWYGCADSFQCPECGEGKPPWLEAP